MKTPARHVGLRALVLEYKQIGLFHLCLFEEYMFTSLGVILHKLEFFRLGAWIFLCHVEIACICGANHFDLKCCGFSHLKRS